MSGNKNRTNTPVVTSGEEQIKIITIENGAGFIENGAGFIKAGFSGEDGPRFIKNGPRFIKNGPIETKLTAEKQSKGENMETVWRDTFYKLGIYPRECPVLLTVPPLTSQADKELITKIMFNKFNVPGLYIATDAVLALLATGRKTGIVLHSTEDATHIVPIHDGRAISDEIRSFEICSRNLTNYLMKLLNEKGILFNSKSKKYEMNDNEIKIDAEISECLEVLFKPAIIAASEPIGIHEVIYNSIMACKGIQNKLFENIILSGENTVFPGFALRLEKELNELTKLRTNSDLIIKVYKQREQKKQEDLAWIGGSNLSSLESFKDLWVGKAEYDESGAEIITRKCI
jgi:actin